MANNTSRIYGGYPVVTVFEIDDDIFEKDDFSVRIFSSIPSIEWALFINNNRRRDDFELDSLECNKDCKYDIVVGPVADDRISVTIRRYLGEKIDIEGLKKQLTYKELTNQYSFHTEKAIACLRKVGVLSE